MSVKFQNYKTFLIKNKAETMAETLEKMKSAHNSVKEIYERVVGEKENFDELEKVLKPLFNLPGRGHNFFGESGDITLTELVENKFITQKFLDNILENANKAATRIAKWSPAIVKSERDGIRSIRDLDDDIGLFFPALYEHIISSLEAVEIYINEVFIKNFPRHFGTFKKRLNQKKGLLSLMSSYSFSVGRYHSLVASLKNLMEDLNPSIASRKHFSEDMDQVHQKLAFMYLKENLEKIQLFLKSFVAALNKQGSNLNNVKVSLRKSDLHYDDLVISFTSSNGDDFEYSINGYAKYHQKREGFYLNTPYIEDYEGYESRSIDHLIAKSGTHYDGLGFYYDNLNVLLDDLTSFLIQELKGN